MTELPVTALSDYALCPLRFKFRYVDGHPGYTNGHGGPNLGMDIGKLTHKALELGLDQVNTLAAYAPHLELSTVEEALALAQGFRQSPVYAAYRDSATHWEYPVSLTVGNLTLNGVVDLVGEDFVLDFKTDQTISPVHHQFQLWAYSQALRKPNAHLAYLRHHHLHTFDAAALDTLTAQAHALVDQLVQGHVDPTPSSTRCGICPFTEICESR